MAAKKKSTTSKLKAVSTKRSSKGRAIGSYGSKSRGSDGGALGGGGGKGGG